MTRPLQASAGARPPPTAGIAITEDRRRAFHRARRPIHADILGVLRDQQRSLPSCRGRDASLRALEHGAVAVVTGQQVGLFLGPLFTVAKAATAVVLARRLEVETGVPVVPVFWLQTEDHDLAEIARCVVMGREQRPHPIGLDVDATQRCSVAHLALPEQVDACLAELGGVLHGLPNATAHLERLARHYRPGLLWADAFAGMLSELFAGSGLLFFNPRVLDVAAHAHAVHRRAIVDSDTISRALIARVSELEAAGLPAPVRVRADAPLSFFHPAGVDGPRHRIVRDGAGLTTLGGSERYTLEEVLALLEAEPLRFSTSALLRPILQDSVLPTVAYVGGPTEVAYFRQLVPLYHHFGMEPPWVVERAQVRIVAERHRHQLERLGLEARALARSEDELLASLATTPGDHASRAEFEASLLGPFDRALASAAPGLPRELEAAVAKTRSTVAAAVAKLADKWEHTRSHRDRERVETVRRLRTAFFPDGVPQERVYGLPTFAAWHGDVALVERLLAELEPGVAEVVELRP